MECCQESSVKCITCEKTCCFTHTLYDTSDGPQCVRDDAEDIAYADKKRDEAKGYTGYIEIITAERGAAIRWVRKET